MRAKDFKPRLEIGEVRQVSASGAHFIAYGRVSIGRNVVIAQNVYISDNLHGYEDLFARHNGAAFGYPGPVIIEDEVVALVKVCAYCPMLP